MDLQVSLNAVLAEIERIRAEWARHPTLRESALGAQVIKEKLTEKFQKEWDKKASEEKLYYGAWDKYGHKD